MKEIKSTSAFCIVTGLIIICVAVMQIFAAGTPIGEIEAYAWEEDTSSAGTSSNSAASGSITVTSPSVKVGETGRITVNMNSNPGIVSWKLALGYDASAIQITGFSGGVFSNVSYNSLSSNPLSFSWYTSGSNNASRGTIATISFKVRETAAPGSYRLTLTGNASDFYNKNRAKVKFSISSGSVTVLDNPSLRNPTITATSGDKSIKLNWTSVTNAKKYAVGVSANGGSWKKVAETSSTSYTIKGLAAGSKYKVVVITYINNSWNTRDLSKAIVASTNPAPEPPTVTGQVQGNTIKLSWTAVSGAQGYAVGYQKGTKWTLLKALPSTTRTFTRSGVPAGTYKFAVVAKIGGSWETSNFSKTITTLTVK